MRPSAHGQTLIVATHRGLSIADRATTGLPPDLLNRAATRLQTLAWLYAFTFFMAAFFPQLLLPAARRVIFDDPVNWAPGVISITVGVSVALAMRVAQLRPAVVTVLALVFEVVSSYGIAAAEFLQPQGLNAGPSWVGLSWVAVWVLLFNVVVPTVPRYAVIAALASVASVPAMVLISISVFPPPVSRPNGWMVFIAFGFPYLLVVIMAYVGARVVYSLGTEVSRARELGSYRLEERFGEGGMGEVWRARHRLLARQLQAAQPRDEHRRRDADRFARENRYQYEPRPGPGIAEGHPGIRQTEEEQHGGDGALEGVLEFVQRVVSVRLVDKQSGIARGVWHERHDRHERQRRVQPPPKKTNP